MSIVQGEILAGRDVNLSPGYIDDQLDRAFNDFSQNYAAQVDPKAKRLLPWYDCYVNTLRISGEEAKAADFMAIKFLTWIDESIDNQEGKIVYVPATSEFFHQVNDQLRFHLGGFIEERNNQVAQEITTIDWSDQYKYRKYDHGNSDNLDVLACIPDFQGTSVTEILCSYGFYPDSNEMNGVFHQFKRAA